MTAIASFVFNAWITWPGLPNPEMFCKLKTAPKFVISCASNVKFACVGSLTRVLTPFVTTACISGYPTPK